MFVAMLTELSGLESLRGSAAFDVGAGLSGSSLPEIVPWTCQASCTDF